MTETTETATPKRGRGHPRRYTLAVAEQILGRPCPHTRFKDGYCRWCANFAAQREIRRRRLEWLDTLTA